MQPMAGRAARDEFSPGGLSVLFQGYYNRIYRYILSMLRDASEAEDLTQETFLRAHRSRETVREQAAQISWLYQIATNVALDRLRRHARRNPMESESDLDEMEVPEPEATSLQKAIEQDEMSECVQRYLSRLSDSYRSVIMLHDMHGLTSPEIAALLGESLPNVKIRLHRAREKLRLALHAACAFSVDESSVLTCDPRD